MTNKQYWRRRRALDRMADRRDVPAAEHDALSWLVASYEQGGLRARNGQSRPHTSAAKSRAS